MKKLISNKDSSSIMFSLLLIFTIIQGSYQEQYKYGNFDLLFVHTDTAVECVVDLAEAELPLKLFIPQNEKLVSGLVSQSVLPYLLRLHNRRLLRI